MNIRINEGQPIGLPFGTRQRGPGCNFAILGTVVLVACISLVGIVSGMVLPEWRANNRYLPNTCVVLDKKVSRDDGGEEGPTYRPEIRIRYEVDGLPHEIWTYDALNTFSSGRAGKEAIIKRFQVGAKYPCWYDPERPGKAVLVRGYSWVPFITLIIPAVFLPLGGAGIYHVWKNRRKTASQLAVERAMRTGDVVMTADPDRPTVPTLDMSERPGTTLAYRLPLGSSPGRTLAAMFLFTLVWNGIAAPFLVASIASHLGWDGIGQSPNWFLTLIIILFGLVGLFLIWICVKQLLITFGIGPTTVEVSDHPLLPGGCCDLVLSQSGRLTMNSMQLLLVCEEQAKYRQGTDTRTETRRVFEQEIIRSEGFAIDEGMPFEARGELRVPTGAMHSFVAAHNLVRWKVLVRGDIAGWPDFEREYPIIVLPAPGLAK